MRSLWLFLALCVPARLALTWMVFAATTTTAAVRIALQVALATAAIGITLIWTFGWRRTGPETLGAPIWWDKLRPIHAIHWSAAALLLSVQPDRAWWPLAYDVVLGTTATLLHHGFGSTQPSL